ncbi:hypothetical protein SPRG_08796 [Saprolegnia parasitica CBS 223.65]|uniref:DNA repair protein n=1 Tax=Saprolegnia parasitica (strain CBS 223.65) TaxID=695850 RepID=A0A067CGA7_SAPPC|nr:hypothetical protein SPRG_08796 [Saprolegnia parasitica CBS 223.65]KDO25852.1 hypothetical protein SPRG_08796 [Saprolegnia parasitica CBS 223.65]|eukprot:XP_012203416.1 hypothetical protein SPRG_08796 [Saprolegnia parasitica CBS 223.65]
MGVTGLWMLLAAGGREVSIESLSGQTLAVDASIWLTQFVKAMRDPEDGSMLRNAHLLGTFQRVAKLLFHGIRPVFVFDGDTPAIKLRTLQRRRARREKNQLSLTQTAQKLLLRQLERRAKQAVVEEETKTEPDVIHINDDEEGEEEKKAAESPPPMPSEEENDDDDAIAEWRDHQEHVEAFQRERRQEAREQFLTLAGKPEEYSLAQIQTFLKSSRFKREMKEQAAAANTTEAGRRIASEADRRYILTTANDARPAPPPAAVATDAQLLDASDSTVGLFSEYVQKQSQSQPIQRAPKILHVDDDDDEVLIGAHGKPVVLKTDHPQWMLPKKKTSQRRGVVWEHKPDGSLVASLDPTKMQLTAEEASILPPSLFDIDVARPQAPVKDEHIEWGDEVEAKDALVSDSDTEWEDVVTQPSNTAPVAAPAAPITVDGGDDDDVEWLDVTPSAVPSAEIATVHATAQAASDDLPALPVPNSGTSHAAVDVDDAASPSTALVASHDAIVIDDTSDVEDNWQDVLPPEAFAAPRPTPLDTLRPSTKVEKPLGVGSPKATAFVVPDAALERATWNAEATPPSSPVLRPSATVLDADALGAWNDEDNLFERRVSKALSADDDDDVVSLGLARNDDALQAVMTTASNLTQWAAGAIKRAIRDHQQKHGGKPLEDDATPRYLSRTTPTEPPAPVVVDSGRFLVADDGGETDAQLKRSRNQQMRDVDGVTDEMQNDVMELLRLFGVPFIVAPMEAEAQCATLEKLGLVTGVITDDSDIFAFGGQRVYKNMFKTSKFVEAFSMTDIERELGLDQESMIALALLLGSDYTDGIHGVGVVNATEIVHAFPGLDGLREFKAWVHDFDLAAQLKPLPKLSEAELKALSPLERFKHTHHKVRRNWHIADAFPNAHVIKAYQEPETDRSDARFSWSTPDLANLRIFCGRTFGWPLEKVNATLLPIVQAATRGWSKTQTRIDSYFTSYKDGVKYAKIRSKRLQAVVQDIHETLEKQAPTKRRKRKVANAETTD